MGAAEHPSRAAGPAGDVGDLLRGTGEDWMNPERQLEYRILQIARDEAKAGPGHQVIPYELEEKLGTSLAEINRAINLLEHRGWIQSGPWQNALGTFQISPAGLDALEQWEGRRGSTRAASMFHFHSPVGVVQTGPGATASVVQALGAEHRGALLHALRLVGEALSAMKELPGSSKEEVLELVEEGRTEIQKPRPNGIRLGAVLSAVAAAIQTAGSLQPAYQALKTVLVRLGIPLP